MGLRIRVSEVKQYLGHLNISLLLKNIPLSALTMKLSKFIGAPELKGKAWDSAKTYAESVHVTLLKGQILANEEIVSANRRFSSKIDSLLNNCEIDEDRLLRLIGLVRQQNEAIVRRCILFPLVIWPSDPFVLAANANLIRGMQKDIADLKALEAATTNLYSTAHSLLDNVSRGIGLVSSGSCFDAATGVYSLDGLDMSWADSIARQWYIKKELEVYGSSQYGGDQGSPFAKRGDPEIQALLLKHFPNMTQKEMSDYLRKLNNEGCGYVALVNAFFSSYTGTEEEFLAAFGFPMYITDIDGNPAYNFDAMLIDLYASTDNHVSFLGIDIVNPFEDLFDPSGTTPGSREYRLSSYLEAHGMSAKFQNNIAPSAENFNKYHNQGELILRVNPVVFEDAHGNTVTNMTGGHAITITGVASDGRLIVSSWGSEYYVNLDTYRNSPDTKYISMQVVTID